MTDRRPNIKMIGANGSVNLVRMTAVIVLSSYVAGAQVGGGIASLVLGPMMVRSVLVPTCLFGRHPGLGAPGGAAIAAETMASVLQGVEAAGWFGECDAVLTGHFSSPEQVAVAADAIDRIRAAPRPASHDGEQGPLVMVDPIMGDFDKGLYIKPETAEAIADELVPRADLIACNLWEFSRLSGRATWQGVEGVARAAQEMRREWLITSVPDGPAIGDLYVGRSVGRSGPEHPQALLASSPRFADAPKGTGDLLKLAFVGSRVLGFEVETSLARAVGVTRAALRRSLDWAGLQAGADPARNDLRLEACQEILMSPPQAEVRRISL